MSDLKKYKALHALSIDGARVEKGEVVSLTAVDAAAWGSDYVEDINASEETAMSEENTQTPAEETPVTPETPAEQLPVDETPVTPEVAPEPTPETPAEETPAA